MSAHPNARTIAAIKKMMQDMEFLVEHPRMQQRNWVASGKEWLPILQHSIDDLQREVQQSDFVTDAHQAVLSALASVGLTVEKRDATSWGYHWHGDAIKGAFPTQAAAIEGGLKAKLEAI